MSSTPNRDDEHLTLALHAEEVSVSKRQVTGETVRVSTVTSERPRMLDEQLTHERVEVERVPIGRQIDAPPPVRQDGDTTILSVVEEIVVVERRLILKEEVRIRRVRVTEHHRETVMVREQAAMIARSKAGRPAAVDPPSGPSGPYHRTSSGRSTMSEHTLVAVYDTAAHAEAAVRDLRAANVPADAISQHAKTGSMMGVTAMPTPPVRDKGFWATLFGEQDEDTSVYDRSIESGSTVVTAKVADEHVDRVNAILEKHDPIDIDERATSHGSSETTTTRTAVTPAMAAQSTPMPGQRATAGSTVATDRDGGTIQLAEETLSVGKRAVSGGTTRIRRYSVETPVEEQVTLHSEKVTLDRRPVNDGRPVTDGSFADKTIEMTETSEEAVVSKTARVKEEVSLRKEAAERTETVKDTVRRDEVKVEQVPGTQTGTGRTTETTTDRVTGTGTQKPFDPNQRGGKI